MKKFITPLAITVSLFSSAAFAQCIGSDSYQTCTDQSGNTYNVSRSGNQTTVNGTAANGNTWNQTSTKMGNQTYTNGMAVDGSTWNSTTTSYGNGNYSVSGTDSDGNYFNRSCNQFGCN